MKIADPLVSAETKEHEQDAEFEFVGGSLALDFANTISSFVERRGEQLTDYSHLVRWGLEAGVLTESDANSLLGWADKHPHEAEKVLGQALALRGSLHWIISDMASGQAPKLEDVATLNAALSHAQCHSVLTRTENGFEWGWSGDPKDLDRMLWPVARAAAELLTSDHLDRVRQCAGSGCTWLFLDMSRN